MISLSLSWRPPRPQVSHENDDEQLPLVYEQETINAYWDRRPVSVVTRIFQLLSVSGSFLTSLAVDAARGRLRETEVQRAIQIREIVTSLGGCEPAKCRHQR